MVVDQKSKQENQLLLEMQLPLTKHNKSPIHRVTHILKPFFLNIGRDLLVKELVFL